MLFRKALTTEAKECYAFIEDARGYHSSMGFEQWHPGYPKLKTIVDDIAAGIGFVFCENEQPLGYCCIVIGEEPAYQNIKGAWSNNRPYAVVHRMAFGDQARGQKLSAKAFNCIKEYCRLNGIDTIRVDTQDENKVMKHILEREGFTYCGLVVFDGGPKLAYDWQREDYYADCANIEYFNKICREERQYALFLYNCFFNFMKNVASEKEKSIIEKCLGVNSEAKVEITNVIYEFTALRDIFDSRDDKGKREFNKKLCEKQNINGNVLKNLEETKSPNAKSGGKPYIEWNLGHIPMTFIENNISNCGVAKSLYTVRCMMNAKPDIVVFYRLDGTPYVTAFECKYESNEGYYDELFKIFVKGKTEPEKNELECLKIKQTEVQRQILEFLFPNLIEENRIVRIIKFADGPQKKEENNSDKEIQIDINDITPKCKMVG